jgi:DNA polymerase I-like protein with 3'-5' exonuclease and polymerase domains
MLILSWHPTYAFFRNPYEYGAFTVDLERFSRAVQGKLREGPRKLNLHPTSEDLLALARRSKVLSYDIESMPAQGQDKHTALDPTQAQLRMIGFGDEEHGLAVYWPRVSDSMKRAVKKVLESKNILKVAINERWFDDRVLRRYGMNPAPVVGLREMRRALSATSPLSLAYITSVYEDAHPWKEDEEDDDKGLVFTDDVEKLAEYNCYDVLYTARDYHSMVREPEWDTPRVQRLYEVHRELARIAAEMHSHGFAVHEENRQFLAHCLRQEQREKRRALRKLLGMPKSWKPNPNAMRRLIFDRYARAGEFSFHLDDPQDPKMWKDGNISVDKNSLIKLIVDPLTPPLLRQAIELYWDAERPGKWVNTFLYGKNVQNAIGPDGRLRAGWNSCGTDTMRWSCSKPNLMNLPQQLRAMYRPAKGHVLIHGDKSQLELRGMEVISGDEVLKQALASGDVYTEDAKDFFKLPQHFTKKDVKPEARKAAKIIHLAKQYGASDKTVFAQALRQDRSLKWSFVSALCRAFDERYKATVAYWHREHKKAAQQGYSEGRVLGTRRHYPVTPDLAEAVNFPVQCTVAEIMNLELIELDRKLKQYLPSAKILVQLHDAVDVECREKDEKLAVQLLEETMGGHKEYTIEGRRATFPIEIKVARNDWSEV